VKKIFLTLVDFNYLLTPIRGFNLFYRNLFIGIFLIFGLHAQKIIKVNLHNQKVYATENGQIIFSGNISTGKRGHRTPSGVFKVLEKDRFHISSKYPAPKGGARMPYMLRVTNSGIAIHQGYVPNYPASHGCIRVTRSTAKKLFKWANVGTKIVIYGNASNYLGKYKNTFKRRYRKRVKRRSYYVKNIHKKHNKRYVINHHKVKKYIRHSHIATGYKIIEIYDD